MKNEVAARGSVSFVINCEIFTFWSSESWSALAATEGKLRLAPATKLKKDMAIVTAKAFA